MGRYLCGYMYCSATERDNSSISMMDTLAAETPRLCMQSNVKYTLRILYRECAHNLLAMIYTADYSHIYSISSCYFLHSVSKQYGPSETLPIALCNHMLYLPNSCCYPSFL